MLGVDEQVTKEYDAIIGAFEKISHSTVLCSAFVLGVECRCTGHKGR